MCGRKNRNVMVDIQDPLGNIGSLLWLFHARHAAL
jgi:hypothetical protein